jgi:hypothetical protein
MQEASSPAPRISPVIIVSYHKTGFVAVNNLLRVLERRSGLNFLRDPLPWEKRRHPLGGCFPWESARGSLLHLDAPEFLCDPSKDFPPDGHLIHELRSPYDLAISSYLYHSQSPPVEVTADYGNVCVTNMYMFLLNKFASRIGVESSQIEAVVELCRSLMVTNMSFYHHLRALPPKQGLRLNTARALISAGACQRGRRERGKYMCAGGGADLMRMASNAVALRALPTASVSRFYEPEWSDRSKVLGLARLIIEKADSQEVVASKRGALAARVVDDFVVGSPILGNASSHGHVTHDYLDRTELTHMLNALTADPVLGPLLARIDTIVCSGAEGRCARAPRA